ncbi:hypothetical protein GGR57DRAFT_296729 [Xylariaceae sp. FL1272]|nr:hypothetical protein GGR57DRAFT_296729 [Xylariaceae sp. FL1272]
MDGLDDFEKALATEKAQREHESRHAERKHRHHHSHRRDRDHDHDHPRDADGHRDRDRHRHDRPRNDDERGQDGHRSKRSRHSKDEDPKDHVYRKDRDHHERLHRHRHDDQRDRDHDLRKETKLKTSDAKKDLPLPDEELTAQDINKTSADSTLVRDSWMAAPSALGIDYTQKGAKAGKSPPPKEEPKRAIHSREMNASYLQRLNAGKQPEEMDLPAKHEVNYTFGDRGSLSRMTKLKGIYNMAEKTGRTVEDVALDRYGSLRDFDDAREEQIEMDRRKVYGEGYVGKEKPSGELYQERKLAADMHEQRQSPPEYAPPDQGVVIPDSATSQQPILDQTALNRLRAQMMKARLKKAPDAAKLEAEYKQAAAAFASKGPEVHLNVMEQRMLVGTRAEAKAVDTKRGRERGLVEQNDDMSVEDMVREERRTRGQAGGEGLRLAERIAKDGKFDDDLEYMDENAEKLAKRVQKSELNLRNAAVGDFQKINKILDNCQLCHHEDRNQPPVAPIMSLGTRVYLTLSTEPEVTEGGAVIVPIQHRTNLLECDDDEWEEIRNFMKCLTRLYHDQGREVVFYENAAAPQRHMHAAMQAVPIPYELGDTAPAFFKEAMLSADEEWSQHKKIIDTGARARDGLGKLAFRRSIAKEMPYFHAWFTLDGGLGHVVEDANRWPRGDLFAREILGGMVDAEPHVIKKQGRWHRSDARVEGFKKSWRKFDWTRVLSDG